MSKKNKILVVDDVSVNQMILRLWLEQRGFDVFIASDGDEAISMYHECKPDITFMDINMPKKDGKIATEVIKVAHPEAIVVALSTDHHLTHQQDDGSYAPFDVYLGKPINFLKIKDLLETYDFELESEV